VALTPAEITQAFIGSIVADLERYKRNLDALADGVYVEDEKGGRVYQTPPDRAANIYLIDRILGRPTENSTPPSSRIQIVYCNNPDDPTADATPWTDEGAEGVAPV
jgi:hypothetical protein